MPTRSPMKVFANQFTFCSPKRNKLISYNVVLTKVSKLILLRISNNSALTKRCALPFTWRVNLLQIRNIQCVPAFVFISNKTFIHTQILDLQVSLLPAQSKRTASLFIQTDWRIYFEYCKYKHLHLLIHTAQLIADKAFVFEVSES